MKIIARRDAVLLVLAVHVAIDVFLVSKASSGNLGEIVLGSRARFFAVMALPTCQGCLIAIWAATARMRFSIRLPLALLATVAPLIVLHILLNKELSVPDTPTLALVLIVQLLTILILINGGRLVRRQVRLWRSGWTAADARLTQFSLRQLLTWTAILAFMLGIGKILFGWLGWTADHFLHMEAYGGEIFAVYNALYALLALALFTVRVRWPVRILLFPLFVAASGVLACSMPLAFEFLFRDQHGVDYSYSLTYSVPQIVYYTITLWPLWLCGYIGPRDDADTGPKETTPCRQQPTTTQEPR